MQTTPTTTAIAAALTEILNSYLTGRTGLVSLTPGGVVEDSERTSRHGERIFFAMPVHQDLGIFASIIDTVVLRVYYEQLEGPREDGLEGGYWINAGLSYTHPGGGSNGHDIATVYLTKDFALDTIRWPNGDLTRRGQVARARAHSAA